MNMIDEAEARILVCTPLVAHSHPGQMTRTFVTQFVECHGVQTAIVHLYVHPRLGTADPQTDHSAPSQAHPGVLCGADLIGRRAEAFSFSTIRHSSTHQRQSIVRVGWTIEKRAICTSSIVTIFPKSSKMTHKARKTEAWQD